MLNNKNVNLFSDHFLYPEQPELPVVIIKGTDISASSYALSFTRSGVNYVVQSGLFEQKLGLQLVATCGLQAFDTRDLARLDEWIQKMLFMNPLNIPDIVTKLIL